MSGDDVGTSRKRKFRVAPYEEYARLQKDESHLGPANMMMLSGHHIHSRMRDEGNVEFKLAYHTANCYQVTQKPRVLEMLDRIGLGGMARLPIWGPDFKRCIQFMNTFHRESNTGTVKDDDNNDLQLTMDIDSVRSALHLPVVSENWVILKNAKQTLRGKYRGHVNKDGVEYEDILDEELVEPARVLHLLVNVRWHDRYNRCNMNMLARINSKRIQNFAMHIFKELQDICTNPQGKLGGAYILTKVIYHLANWQKLPPPLMSIPTEQGGSSRGQDNEDEEEEKVNIRARTDGYKEDEDSDEERSNEEERQNKQEHSGRTDREEGSDERRSEDEGTQREQENPSATEEQENLQRPVQQNPVEDAPLPGSPPSVTPSESREQEIEHGGEDQLPNSPKPQEQYRKENEAQAENRDENVREQGVQHIAAQELLENEHQQQQQQRQNQQSGQALPNILLENMRRAAQGRNDFEPEEGLLFVMDQLFSATEQVYQNRRNQVQALQTELATSRRLHQDAVTRFANERMQNDALFMQVATQRASVQSLMDQTVEAHREIGELRILVDNKRAENEALRNKIRELKEKARQETSTLKEKNTNLQQQLSDLQQEKAELKQHCSESEQRMEERRLAVEQAQQELQDYRRMAEGRLKKQQQLYELALEDKSRAIIILQQEVRQLQTVGASMADPNEQLDKKVDTLMSSASSLANLAVPPHTPSGLLTLYYKTLSLYSLQFNLYLSDDLNTSDFRDLLNRLTEQSFPSIAMLFFNDQLTLQTPTDIYHLDLHPILLNLHCWCLILTTAQMPDDGEGIELSKPDELGAYAANVTKLQAGISWLWSKGHDLVRNTRLNLVQQNSSVYAPNGIIVLYYRVALQMQHQLDSGEYTFEDMHVEYPSEFTDEEATAALKHFESVAPINLNTPPSGNTEEEQARTKGKSLAEAQGNPSSSGNPAKVPTTSANLPITSNLASAYGWDPNSLQDHFEDQELVHNTSADQFSENDNNEVDPSEEKQTPVHLQEPHGQREPLEASGEVDHAANRSYYILWKQEVALQDLTAPYSLNRSHQGSPGSNTVANPISEAAKILFDPLSMHMGCI